MKKISIIVFIISMMVAFVGVNSADASVFVLDNIVLAADEDPDKDEKNKCCEDKKEGECCKDSKSKNAECDHKKAECENKKPCEGQSHAEKAEKKDCKSSSCDEKKKTE